MVSGHRSCLGQRIPPRHGHDPDRRTDRRPRPLRVGQLAQRREVMPLPMSDPQVAAAVLKHIADGTTDAGHEVWREPVENYRSQPRLDAEIKILRRFPTAFCPSSALAENGAYVAREAAGVPIIAVRGQDGKVRAFRNACRHRGMRLAEGAGCTNAFMCRYHGWTYGLDGALRHVPHE